MRIGIDATWAGMTGGTASYTHGLVEALTRVAINEEFFLYFHPRDPGRNPLWDLEHPSVSRRVLGGLAQPGRSLWSLGRAAQQDELDVFHSPAYFAPLWPGRTVVTFHDANMFLQFRQRFIPGRRLDTLSLCVQAAISARMARALLTDSRAAAQEIQRVFRLPVDRISVVYPGIDQSYFSPHSPGESMVRETYGLDEYLLYVGEIAPQKNLLGLLRAFGRAAWPRTRLAIVGGDPSGYFPAVLQPEIRRLGLESSVSYLGQVPQDHLVQLYAGARALLLVSFAEGFGLPPLEALAAGVPVIASNVSSLPEVLGDAAILVDPHSEAGMAEAIRGALASNYSVQQVDRGRRQAGLYTWDRAAAETLRVYHRVAG